MLRERAEAYARVALANIEREFPRYELYLQSDPSPIPAPRALHPAFYGSLDWHSCVEMHWVLVRLLRLVPDRVPEDEVRNALDAHLSAEALAGETRFFEDPAHRLTERPYGWAWTLRLAAELLAFDDADAGRWAANLLPLADLFVERFLEWLPKATYPIRYGIHANSAFALSFSLPFARKRAQAGDVTFLEALEEAATRWFAGDVGYAADWEPSGADFLSPALMEAELMSSLLPPAEFPSWLERFLPGIADREPGTLFTPAVVTDPSDGHIAHLHGLNLSRAWCWRRLAAALPGSDPRVPVMLEAAERHAAASLDQAVGSDYMVEHWLPAYAVLHLSPQEDLELGLERGPDAGSLAAARSESEPGAEQTSAPGWPHGQPGGVRLPDEIRVPCRDSLLEDVRLHVHRSRVRAPAPSRIGVPTHIG